MARQSDGEILVAGLSGSLREMSYTRMAVRIALDGAEEAGARVRMLDLRDYELVFCEGKDDEVEYPAGVHRLRGDLEAAQGIVIGTPEYHGGMSGVLKNALDLMGFPQFEGKMVGLVGVSGGAMGALGALGSLRNIGRSLHAWVIPEQAFVPHAPDAFDAEGRLRDEGLYRRVHEVGRQVARFAHLHTSEMAQEFLRAWVGAPENPGGESESS